MKQFRTDLIKWNETQNRTDKETALEYGIQLGKQLEIPLEKITPTYVKNLLKHSNRQSLAAA